VSWIVPQLGLETTATYRHVPAVDRVVHVCHIAAGSAKVEAHLGLPVAADDAGSGVIAL